MGWGLVMPAPLSRDLRERIIAAVESGSSMRGAAARFAVSASSAIKLMARVRATGSVAPAPTVGTGSAKGCAAGAGEGQVGHHLGGTSG